LHLNGTWHNKVIDISGTNLMFEKSIKQRKKSDMKLVKQFYEKSVRLKNIQPTYPLILC
jgi:hypothetical protein